MVSVISPIISTRQPDRLADFYADVFGAVETMRQPEEGDVFFVGLTIDGADLGIVNESIEGDNHPRILLSIEVPDVDATRSRVGPAGGELGAPAQDMPWGQRVAHVRDPDGNAINLTSTRT